MGTKTFSVAALAMFVASSASWAQSVKIEPEFRFPGAFFPAYALSTVGKDEKGPTESATSFGYMASGEFGVKVSDAPPNAKVKVRVEIPDVSVAGEIESTASAEGKTKNLVPRLSWNQLRLASLAQPLSTDVVFKVFVDGNQVGEERRPVRVRATNDAPLNVCKGTAPCADYTPVMAGFVNENHPAIDALLRSVLDVPAMPVKQWVGTQGGDDMVLKQVWALWYYLQRTGVTYSSITTVADTSPELHSQTIRPFSQSLRTHQANCIDGTVLFASVLRKIGIEPMIVLIPGHAFLGFYLDAQQTRPAFLETTMLNSEHNPFHNGGPTKTGTGLAKALGVDTHMKKSWDSFTEALRVGNERFQKVAPAMGKERGYRVVSIKKARESGILPLPL